MGDIAIRIENLGKQYRIGGTKGRFRYRRFSETAMSTLAAPLRRLRTWGKPVRPADTFWALRDISFEIKQGEAVGIIGRNGAGKSTLLKILSRITEPTEGRVQLYGRVGSLLEVGTGFHPELTGRENIYLNGAILGMRRIEIAAKFDEIVAFAEVDKFLDTPVKHYSSGMYVRLAFAVAAHLEPQILLVDEVLAVGDAAFQKKCLGKMSDVTKGGRTVLFVSHDMGAIRRLCPHAIWIDGGRVRLQQDAETVISSYLNSNASADGQCIWPQGIANPGVDELRIDAIRLVNEQGSVASKVDVRTPFGVEVEYRILRPIPFCRVGITVTTSNGTILFETYDADNELFAGPRNPGSYLGRCCIPGNFLNAARYIVSINAGIPNVKNLAHLESVLAFDVEDTGAVGSHMYSKRLGAIRPKLQWNVSEIQP